MAARTSFSAFGLVGAAERRRVEKRIQTIFFIDYPLSCKLLHTPVLDLHYVNSPSAVNSDAVREIKLAWKLPIAAEHAQYLPVQVQLDDAVILTIAHIDGIFTGDVIQAPRRSDVRPFAEKLSVAVEYLHTLVSSIGDVNAAGFVQNNIVNQVEFAVAGSLLAPVGQVLAVGSELGDAGIDIPIGD